jgi:hypothetical protein
MARGIQFDETRFPIVVVKFAGTATDAEFGDYLSTMSRMLGKKQVTATILDATEAGATSALQRRRQADWLKKNADVLKLYSVGTAFVITSPLVRGALTAILWVQPMPAPHTLVATLPEAEAWAKKQLAQHPLPGGRAGTQ